MEETQSLGEIISLNQEDNTSHTNLNENPSPSPLPLAPPPSAPPPPPAPSLSKNQLKRIKRTQRWEEIKINKKEQKKAQKRKYSEEKEKEKQQEDESHKGDHHDGDRDRDGDGNRDHLIDRQVLKQQRKEEFQMKCKENFIVIIDCGWEEQHTDSTLKSLTQQIMFCYGLNRRYEKPSRLFITGVGPRTTALLSKNNSQSWISASIHTEEFPEVLENYYQELQEIDQKIPSTNPLQSVIYLTSDATDVLEELDNNSVYVIGGIVDRNRLKGATFNKAQQLQVRTAKLPIKENMKMAATHVLTVNHVFDILKQYADCHSWPEAIEKVLPQRKGAQLVTSEPEEERDGDDQEKVEVVRGEGDSIIDETNS